MIPAAFIGLGDMARESLMLRAVRKGKRLAYVGAKPASRQAEPSRSSGSSGEKQERNRKAGEHIAKRRASQRA